MGAGAEEGGEGGGEGVGAGGRHVVGGVAGGGGVVAGHGGGGRGEVLGGGGQGRLGWEGWEGWEAAQLTGVDGAERRPLPAVSVGLQGTPGRGREVLLLLVRTGGAARAPARLHLGLVLGPPQLVPGGLLPPAQLGLDAGRSVAWRGSAPGVVVVVPGAALPASLLLVQPLSLPELRPPVLEPDLAHNNPG